MYGFRDLMLLILLLSSSSAFAQTGKTGVANGSSLRDGLARLLDHEEGRPQIIDHLQTKISEQQGYTLHRIELTLWDGDGIPTYLLIPNDGQPPHPVMICLQGHAPGMYISIGETRNDRDKKLIAGGRDLALQAIAHGWAALTVEQRGFGEQASGQLTCNHLALNHFMQGESLLGKRVQDISIVVDFIESREDLDHHNIGIMGNSSGGTTSYFAACMETRIDLAVVSSAFSTYAHSWLKHPHCACGYVPGLLTLADMPDLAALIAPRHLLIIAGKEDYLADIEGVRAGYKIAQSHYREKENILLVEGEGGHQFYPKPAWPIIDHFLADQSFP